MLNYQLWLEAKTEKIANMNKKNASSSCLTRIIVFIIIILLAIISGRIENDYEKEGDEFETWIGEAPHT